MNKIFQFIAIVCFAVAVSACEVSLNANNRSGTLEDDYVAEPLSSMSEKYENALVVSNSFIDHLKKGNTNSIYTGLFSEELRSIISKQEFENILSQIIATKGNVTKYKKMQWGFISGEENGMDFIGSVKIVEHEKGMMKYLLIFNDDGKFNEITGIRFKERSEVSPPGQF